jgi:hypothetical protein
MKTSELTDAALDWAVAKCAGHLPDGYSFDPYVHCYSTSWAKGGPIIEREGISVDRTGLAWTADISDSVGGYIEHTESGPTPLIAAMRCYVPSKLGDNIDIPKELL